MKRFNFLFAAIALVLTITAVSCTTMAGSQDDYYNGQRASSNRVYVDDPYRGTVVLERDPRTGRYYEVNSYDPYYNNGYYGNRSYGRVYRSNGYGYGYPSRRNNGGYYNGNNSTTNNQNNNRKSEEYKKEKNEARDKVLGRH